MLFCFVFLFCFWDEGILYVYMSVAFLIEIMIYKNMSGSLNEILQLIELLFYSYLKKKKETLVD
jgi:hypothetical protein